MTLGVLIIISDCNRPAAYAAAEEAVMVLSDREVRHMQRDSSTAQHSTM